MLNPVGAATSGERGHTVSARSRAILSAFSRLGYDPILGKIDRGPKVEKPPQLVGLDRGESVYEWARRRTYLINRL